MKQIHIYKYGQSHTVILHQQVSVTQGVSQQVSVTQGVSQ